MRSFGNLYQKSIKEEGGEKSRFTVEKPGQHCHKELIKVELSVMSHVDCIYLQQDAELKVPPMAKTPIAITRGMGEPEQGP